MLIGSAFKCSSYIDDIYIQGNKQNAEKVRNHLEQYGLECKPVETIGDEVPVRVLGVKVKTDLNWERESQLPRFSNETITKRQIHKIVGELLGHFPKAGWLRVACAFLQRKAAEEKINLDEKVCEKLMNCLKDVFDKLNTDGDPVSGVWCVEQHPRMKVWPDASSLAIGTVLEVNGNIIEDASWL